MKKQLLKILNFVKPTLFKKEENNIEMFVYDKSIF